MMDLNDGGFIALKGFCFQFDKTILEIFNQPKTSILVEQIQDLNYDDYVIQVKHHDTKYTAAQIKHRKKKPLIQLLDLFKADPAKHYVLYIYLKDVSAGKQLLTIADLEGILGAESGHYTKKLKADFLKQFSLIHAEDFKAQHQEVIAKIRKEFNSTIEEAEFYYALISSYLLQLVIDNPPERRDNRKTSLQDVSNLIQKSQKAVFNSTYAVFQSKEKYHRLLRKQFFNTSLNLSPFERFFLIEVNTTIDDASLVEIVTLIKTKWHKSGIRVPRPFGPYICFRNISDIQLKSLKKQLRSDEFIIKDGYDYYNADFDVDSLIEKVTNENKIKFRIINNVSEFELAISHITSTKELYQFYLTEPIHFDGGFKHIKVQIEILTDIKTIV